MTEQQKTDLLRLKACRPFMIAYGALNESTGEFILGCAPTMHKANKLARAGWKVWSV